MKCISKWHICKMTTILSHLQYVNSSPPSATYMCRWTGPPLVQVMAFCLFSTKPLPEPMLTYCQLDQCWLIVNWIPGNKLQWNLNQNTKFSFMKMHLKMSSAKWRQMRQNSHINRWSTIFTRSDGPFMNVASCGINMPGINSMENFRNWHF